MKKLRIKWWKFTVQMVLAASHGKNVVHQVSARAGTVHAGVKCGFVKLAFTQRPDRVEHFGGAIREVPLEPILKQHFIGVRQPHHDVACRACPGLCRCLRNPANLALIDRGDNRRDVHPHRNTCL